MAKAIIALVCTIAKVDTTVNDTPYAVVKGVHGGAFCVFAKKGEDKAEKLLASLPVGKQITLKNVGFAKGSVYLYDDTTLSK